MKSVKIRALLKSHPVSDLQDSLRAQRPDVFAEHLHFYRIDPRDDDNTVQRQVIEFGAVFRIALPTQSAYCIILNSYER